MDFKKKGYFIVILVFFILAYSTTCYAQEQLSENEQQALADDEVLPYAEVWATVRTTSGTIFVPANTYVPGASAYYIKLLQATLNKLGHNCGVADGIYGTNTRNGIMSFQKELKLTVDGIAGERTWSEASIAIYDRGLVVSF